MRKKIALICYFILMVCTGGLYANDIRLISVTGLAQKNFKPDIARLHITVWGKGHSASIAQASNVANFEALAKSIEAFKVKKEDVVTTTYELNPEYVYNQKSNRNIISGYIVNQNITVTLRNVLETAGFLDSLVSLSSAKPLEGGVNINSLVFDLDKRAEEERALLSEAVKSAREQAEVLALAAKVKLKGVYRLAPRGDGQGPAPLMEMSIARSKSASGGATQLMSGEVKVEGSVFVDYLIE